MTVMWRNDISLLFPYFQFSLFHSITTILHLVEIRGCNPFARMDSGSLESEWTKWDDLTIARYLTETNGEQRQRMLKMLWDEHKEKGRDVNGISQKLDPTTRSMFWGFKLAQDVANEEEQKQEWKLEYAERLIPKFSMEGNYGMVVEEWAEKVRELLSHFSGTEIMKIMSISESIDLPELKKERLDFPQHTVHTFLRKVVDAWNNKHSIPSCDNSSGEETERVME